MDLNMIVLTQGLVAWLVVVTIAVRSFPRPPRLLCIALGTIFSVYGLLALFFWTYGFILSAVASSYCWGSLLSHRADDRNDRRRERIVNA